MYLGDTARVPYGNRSQATIYEFTAGGGQITYLNRRLCPYYYCLQHRFGRGPAARIQQSIYPNIIPTRKILGVLLPAAEAAMQATSTNEIGVLATFGTVASGAFDRELTKLDPHIRVTSQAAPFAGAQSSKTTASSGPNQYSGNI